MGTIDASDPWYRFGQCWFVRMEAPRYDAELVAGWSLRFSGELRVVFDDAQEIVVIDETHWAAIWEADASRRATLELSTFPLPPFPTLEQLEPDTGEAASPP